MRTVIDLCARRLPDTYGLDPVKDIQVLSPTKRVRRCGQPERRTAEGAESAGREKKAEKASKIYTLREGDRVMQIKNNYSLRWEKPGNAGIDGTGVLMETWGLS